MKIESRVFDRTNINTFIVVLCTDLVEFGADPDPGEPWQLAVVHLASLAYDAGLLPDPPDPKDAAEVQALASAVLNLLTHPIPTRTEDFANARFIH